MISASLKNLLNTNEGSWYLLLPYTLASLPFTGRKNPDSYNSPRSNRSAYPVPGKKGCHTQGKTIDEAIVRTKGGIELCREDSQATEPFNTLGILRG